MSQYEGVMSRMNVYTLEGAMVPGSTCLWTRYVPRMNESCLNTNGSCHVYMCTHRKEPWCRTAQVHKYSMSHIWIVVMSQHEWVMSRIYVHTPEGAVMLNTHTHTHTHTHLSMDMACFIYEWVMSRYECVTSHVFARHVTCICTHRKEP